MDNNNMFNPEYVRSLFNEMSGSYERVNYITSFGFSLRWRSQFLNKLPGTEDSLRVLDLMTGLGETWEILREKYPNSSIDALDYSEVMIGRAKKKTLLKPFRGIDLLHQNVLQNEIPSESYDVIVCAFGLKTLNKEQIRILSQEIYRILKPGGYISFIEISVPRNRILKKIYGFYVGKIIPMIGKVLLGNPDNYKMLWKYTKMFENAEESGRLFRKSGFDIIDVSYFADCSTGFWGRKLN